MDFIFKNMTIDCVRRIGKSMFCAPPNRPCSCRFANSTLLDCNLNCNRPCAVNYDCVRPIVHLPNSNRMAILMSQCKNYECLLEVKNLKLPICGNCSSKCQIRTDGSLAHCDGVDIKSAGQLKLLNHLP